MARFARLICAGPALAKSPQIASNTVTVLRALRPSLKPDGPIPSCCVVFMTGLCRLPDKPYGVWVMAAISFADSSFLPLVPDVLLAPWCSAGRIGPITTRPSARWRRSRAPCSDTPLAPSCGIRSANGSSISTSSRARWRISVGSTQSGAAQSSSSRASPRSPISSSPLSAASPATISLAFIVLSLITRGARFFVLALLLVRYGEQVRHALDRHLTVIVSAFVVILVGGIVGAMYLF